MGVMNRMRNNMQVVLLVVIAAFIMTIIFSWGMGGFKGKKGKNIIGKINNQEITVKQFYNALNEQKKKYREQKGQELSLQEQEQIKDGVWKSIVSEVLWQNEIEKRELNANGDEIYFYLENNPPEFLRGHEAFQTDGKFDIKKYLQALHNPQADEWVPVENYARSTIPFIKLNNFITSTIFVNETDAFEKYSHKNTKYNINSLLIPIDKFDNNSITISEKNINKYYEENKKEKYLIPEKRVIQYKVWTVKPSKEDTTLVMNDIENIKLRYSEGEKFKDLARIFSQGPSANQGGDLGYIERGQMVPDFERAAFNAPLNKIVGPVKTRFGYHLILVTDKKIENGTTKFKTSHILLKITSGPNTIDNMLSKARIFSYDAKDLGFPKALIEHSYNADTTIGGFTKTSFFFKKVGYFPYLSQWAFKNKIGTASDPIQLKDKIIVAQILEETPERHKSIDKVKKSIVAELKKTEKKELASKLARKIYQEIINNDSNFNLIGEKNNNVKYYENTDFSLDNPPVQFMNNNIFAQVIKSMEIGQISPPIEIYNGYCIIKKTNSDINKKEFETTKESQIKQLLRQKQSKEIEKWQKHLKEEAKINDYRSDYF